MGSAAVQPLVCRDELHVAYDVGGAEGGLWWAVGREGSYGGSCDRGTAIEVALATSASTGGQRRIVVHYRYGRVAYVITRTRRAAPSQVEQDSVP